MEKATWLTLYDLRFCELEQIEALPKLGSIDEVRDCPCHGSRRCLRWSLILQLWILCLCCRLLAHLVLCLRSTFLFPAKDLPYALWFSLRSFFLQLSSLPQAVQSSCEVSKCTPSITQCMLQMLVVILMTWHCGFVLHPVHQFPLKHHLHHVPDRACPLRNIHVTVRNEVTIAVAYWKNRNSMVCLGK